MLTMSRFTKLIRTMVVSAEFALMTFIPPLAAGLAVALVAGCVPEPPVIPPPALGLVPFASGTAPLTNVLDIAIVSESVACTVNSFESQIQCANRHTGEVSVFGREGEGPGEFDAIVGIERAPGGRVAAMDPGTARMTVFETDGAVVSETDLPPIFRPFQLHDGQLFGYKLGQLDFSATEELPAFVPMAADANSGEVLWHRTDLAELLDRECFTGVAGALMPNGGLVFEVCGNDLAFLDGPDAQDATVLVSPRYVKIFPNDRDEHNYREGLTGTGRRGGMSERDIEMRMAVFRDTPKEWILKPRPFRLDGRNRLWVATTLVHDAFSYFDIWTGTDYVGSVRVEDRLLAFDILGSTLVTLVERADDVEGINERGVDWYDIGKVDDDWHTFSNPGAD